jgi:hypothetical protein
MTISLASGSNSAPIDFRIRNDQLVTPDLVIDTNNQVVSNNSVAELLVNPLLPPNQQDMMKLGRPFFSAAYLLVDYESFTFTIWKANQTSDVNLIPVVREQSNQPCSSNFMTTPLATPASSPHTLPLRTILGAITGSLTGLAAMLLLIWWVLRSRKQNSREVISNAAFMYALQQKAGEEFCSELPDRSSRCRIYEAPTDSQRAPYELEGA